MRKKTMREIIIIFAAILVLANPGAAKELSQMPEIRMDFDNRAEMSLWRSVNDGVMGGRSSGGPSFENGNLIFSGTINTNGGGFSSIRRPVRPGQMAGAQQVTLRVKTDGRGYRLRFRTNVTYRGRRIAFQKPIPVAKSGEWATVSVTLDNMQASLFGRSVSGAEFVPGDVVETGIILADGRDGPFNLEVDWIKIE